MQSLLDLYRQGGITLIVIGIMSVMALGIGLERATAFRRFRARMWDASERINGALAEGNLAKAQAINSTAPAHPATPLFESLLAEKMSTAAQIRRRQQRLVRSARAGIWIVGTIAATAPFVGLFGTVHGIMQAFRQISTQGGGGFEVVSGGISEALIATAGGIAVGIEAMFLFNYLQARGGELFAELRETIDEINEAMERRRAGSA